MDASFLIPLAVFAAVAVLVGICVMVNMNDKEHEVSRELGAAQTGHRRRVAELDQQLDRVKRGNAP
jgi:hypothetical protein